MEKLESTKEMGSNGTMHFSKIVSLISNKNAAIRCFACTLYSICLQLEAKPSTETGQRYAATLYSHWLSWFQYPGLFNLSDLI